MRVTLSPRDDLILWRDGGPRFYRDSTLFTHARRALNNAGLDVINKRPERDGHMLSAESYLRDREWRFCWYYADHQIRPAYEDFNKDGFVRLIADRLSPDPMPAAMRNVQRLPPLSLRQLHELVEQQEQERNRS